MRYFFFFFFMQLHPQKYGKFIPVKKKKKKYTVFGVNRESDRINIAEAKSVKSGVFPSFSLYFFLAAFFLSQSIVSNSKSILDIFMNEENALLTVKYLKLLLFVSNACVYSRRCFFPPSRFLV